MSGEDDRANAKASKNPFFDELDAPPPARVRRAKPPPSVITAGGVDMARAHASGIQVKDTGSAQKVDEPRVVLAVETDPRKVPTDKKLLEGRDASADGSRAAMLPGTPGATPMPAAVGGTWGSRSPGLPSEEATVVTAPAPAPAPVAARAPDDRKLPLWMRVAMVVVGLLLVAGVMKRAGLFQGDEPAAPAVTLRTPPPPAPPPSPAPPPAVTAPAVETATAAPPQTAVAPPEPPKPAPPPAEPAPAAAPPRTAKPVQAPGPPKPTFKPPFELPSEKE
jgi:hypothetical protein